MSSKKEVLFLIGSNDAGEFGFVTNEKSVKDLVKCPNESICRVFSSDGYSIYANKNCSQLWAAGGNSNGQCGVGANKNARDKYEPIKYFNINNINIRKVCTNKTGRCTFFISDKGELYGCGKNSDNNFGLNNDGSNQCEPVLIHAMKNVIDAQSSLNCSVVLCSSDKQETQIIIRNWSRKYNIPSDIVDILVLFCKFNIVYSTTNNPTSGHPQKHVDKGTKMWNEVDIFGKQNVNIIKMEIGECQSFFLDDKGILWACGRMDRLGFGGSEYEMVYVPQQIKFFVANDIRIKEIAAGYEHALALDMNGNVYSWGYNRYGQCGFDRNEDGDDSIYTPRQIEYFDKYEVSVIKCGEDHSYVGTKCKRNFMFGYNGDNECIKFDGEKRVSIPHQIDDIVRQKCNIEEIIDVFPGRANTKIVCIAH